jgi:DNA-directed RNA polymerase subunit E"
LPRTRKSVSYKACLKCKYLVEPSVEVCPNCGSREFTYDWEGAVIILDPKNSKLAKLLGIEKPGRYAIKTR